MHSVQMKHKDLCPQCGTVLDGATSLEGKFTPKPGDVTVCAYCATFLKYDEYLFLRILPEEEFAKLEKTEQDQLNAIRKFVVQAQLKASGSKLNLA